MAFSAIFFEYFTHRKKVDAIWYLVELSKRQEEKEIQDIARLCQKGETKGRVFLPSCERMKRYQGAWHREYKYLFPGSIFLKGNSREEILAFLRLIFLQKHTLEKEDRIRLLTHKEEAAVTFLQALCRSDQRIPLSRGYILKGKTFVTEGPLMGKEKFIQRIDRHKRLAYLDIMNSLEKTVDVGLEIYEKA